MKLLKEPLLHFAVAGVVLFSIYASLNERQPMAESIEPVRIGPGEVQWLQQTYANQWLRPPAPVELQGLVTDLVNEELLAREALAMGLGENDTIIRRRLAQKLKFLVEDTSRLAEPTEAELRQYFDKNDARFETGATVSFTHIFFNPQDRADAAHDATAVVADLRKVELNAQTAKMGDRFLLDSEFREADEQSVSSMFGGEFAKALFALEPGQWGGPLKSGYESGGRQTAIRHGARQGRRGVAARNGRKYQPGISCSASREIRGRVRRRCRSLAEGSAGGGCGGEMMTYT